ncbi:hypothetical protein D3C81_2157060 [compost metagenome]
MAVGKQGHALTRRNLLSQAQHYHLDPGQANAILDEVASWEPALQAHYREHLATQELQIALSAIGGRRLLT